MPSFVQVVAGITGFLIAILVLDSLRRRGLPRLSLPTFRGGGIPDELARRLAKTVTDGDFDGSQFRKSAFRTLFPTQIGCPHCKGGSKGRNVWGITQAERLLGNLGRLARQIQRKRFCRGCLTQLSGIAKVRGGLKELGTKEHRSLAFSKKKKLGCILSLLVSSCIVASILLLALVQVLLILP